MKKVVFQCLAVGFTIAASATTAVFAVNEIRSAQFNAGKVIFDGDELDLGEERLLSIVKEGEEYPSNYMPVRAVLEAIGYEVQWDGEQQAVVITSPAFGTEEGRDNKQDTQAPVIVSSCAIKYEDTPYRWPYIEQTITNRSDRVLVGYQIVLLAYDIDGTPLALYWDARNVDQSGGHGNVGFGNGVDYGIVAGIEPYAPKSFDWLIEMNDYIIPESTATLGGWNLFDGWWDQPDGLHRAKYIVANIKQAEFDDGFIWENPEYEEWLGRYKGKAVDLELLNAYYVNE